MDTTLEKQNSNSDQPNKNNKNQDPQNEQKAKENAEQQERLRNTILSSVLDQKARARLSTLSLAKPEKGKSLENMIIQMAQYGRIQQQLNEDQMVKLLEQISQQQRPKTTVKFERRRIDDDEDEDDI